MISESFARSAATQRDGSLPTPCAQNPKRPPRLTARQW
jgi:hypothetical protein